MPTFMDVSGQRFGRLVAVDFVKIRDSSGRSCIRWNCQCDCGGVATTDVKRLRSGETQSCGCLQRERTGIAARTHGMSSTTEYKIWGQMLSRCQSDSNPDYRHYGGRGIEVCPRWHDFQAFYADMGPRPQGLTLERVDTNGNYEPTNCRWATRREQGQNTRRCKLNTEAASSIRRMGGSVSQEEIAKEFGVSQAMVSRILLGKSWSQQDTELF